jgi:hypothetical protein
MYGDAAERHTACKHDRRFAPVYAQTSKWRRPTCASSVRESMSAEKTLLALPVYEREQGEIRRRGYVSVHSDSLTRILRTEIRPFD